MASTLLKQIIPYTTLARIDSWSKNLILFLGVSFAYAFSGAPLSPARITLCFFAICLASSANYVLNESIDAKSDIYHPIKKNRASIKKELNKKIVAVEYIAFFSAAILLSHTVNDSVLLAVALYLVCAWLYNIPPVRLKDKAYCDVMLESLNYPLRVLMGWYCVLPAVLPPSSIIIITWSVGAFTMSLKRLAEFQLFRGRKNAALYRRSYATYTMNSLAISGFVYAMLTVFGVTILLLKYKIELILIMPALIALLAWYFLMGLEKRLFIIYPERLLGNKMFVGICVAILATGIVTFQITIPSLHTLIVPLKFGK